MWHDGTRVFYQNPEHADKNRKRSEKLEIWPGLTATGEPGAYLTTDGFRLFVNEAQAWRITDEIADALEAARDLLSPIHTTTTGDK